MNLEELYELTLWIDDNIRKPNLVSKYKALYSAVNRNAQPNQQQQPFENERNSLFEQLDQIQTDSLNNEQIDFLISTEIYELIGVEGRRYLENILYINALDIATVANKISERNSKLTQCLVRFQNIKDGLSGIIDISETKSNDVLLKVHFAGKTDIENVVDLKKWATAWFDIGRGIAMLEGKAPEDIRVVGARKGTIIIELAVFAGIATSISAIILSVLKVADKVLEIKKKSEEIKGLKLSNSKIQKDLENEAENEKLIGIDKITNDLLFRSIDKGNGELKTIIEKAVKNLVDFIENGGEVDCTIPVDDENSKDSPMLLAKVSDNFKEIRKLESKLKLLGPEEKDND